MNAGFGTSVWGTPIYVGLDYGVHKDITIGGESSYCSDSQVQVCEMNNYKFSLIGIGANRNYDFNRILEMPSKWDLYAGSGFNYYIRSYDNDLYKTNDHSNIGLGG